MAIMTQKMRQQLYDIRCAAAAGLARPLWKYVDDTTTLLLRHGEEFPSRAALQGYIDTLTDLITTKVNNP